MRSARHSPRKKGRVGDHHAPVAYEGSERGRDGQADKRGATGAGVEDSQRSALVVPLYHGGHQGRERHEPGEQDPVKHAEYDRENVASRQYRTEEPERRGYRAA